MNKKRETEIEKDLIRIESLIKKKDIKSLLEIGKHLGFLERNTRKKAYQLIMNTNPEKVQSIINNHFNNPKYRKMEEVINHDISRSFNHLSISKKLTHKQRLSIRKDFTEFMFTLMGAHPDIQYYQGMNDIAEQMYMCYDRDYRNFGYIFLEYFQQNFLDVFTGMEFDIALNILTEKVRDVLGNSKLHIANAQNDNEKIGFLWPWLLTTFIHSISSVEIINRIQDFVQCSQKFDIVCICAAVIIEQWEHNKLKPNVSFDRQTEVFYHRNQDHLNWNHIMEVAINLSNDEKNIALQDIMVIDDMIKKKMEVRSEEERMNNLKNSPYSNLEGSPVKQPWYGNLFEYWTEQNSRVEPFDAQVNKTCDAVQTTGNKNGIKKRDLEENKEMKDSKLKNIFIYFFGNGDKDENHINKTQPNIKILPDDIITNDIYTDKGGGND